MLPQGSQLHHLDTVIMWREKCREHIMWVSELGDICWGFSKATSSLAGTSLREAVCLQMVSQPQLCGVGAGGQKRKLTQEQSRAQGIA